MIVDEDRTVVLIVYPEPGYGIHVEPKNIIDEMMDTHRRDKRRLRNKASWTSHTVAIVDQSGSMRAIDIDKNLYGSDLVWFNLALMYTERPGTGGKSIQANDLAELLLVMKQKSEMCFGTIVLFRRKTQRSAASRQ